MKYEIRLRNVKPELIRLADQLQKEFKTKSNTDVIEKLITTYQYRSGVIDQLTSEVNSLERQLATFKTREGNDKFTLFQILQANENSRKNLLKLIKAYGTNTKRRGRRSPDIAPGTKKKSPAASKGPRKLRKLKAAKKK